MTNKTKQLINGSVKWLITIAFAAGSIAYMVKANADMLNNHEKRIGSCELKAERI